MADLWEGAYTCPIYTVNRTTESANLRYGTHGYGMVKILGCGVEVKAKANKDLSTFDLNNLRWEKIIICTDADYDGYLWMRNCILLIGPGKLRWSLSIIINQISLYF